MYNKKRPSHEALTQPLKKKEEFVLPASSMVKKIRVVG